MDLTKTFMKHVRRNSSRHHQPSSVPKRNAATESSSFSERSSVTPIVTLQSSGCSRLSNEPMNHHNGELTPARALAAPYKHRPLDISQPSLRLLRFITNRDGNMECHLKHFTVDDAPSYRALSYMWGQHPATKQICVNGESFSIRPNLYEFFKKYKLRHLGQWLWVDQVCIDQNTMAERNHQVQLMSEIYRNAIQVIIWLNSEDRLPVEGDRLCDEICVAKDHHVVKEPCCTWLRAITEHSYWGRLWIIQEVLLACDRAVWYRESVLSWFSMGQYVLEAQAGAQFLTTIVQSKWQLRFLIMNTRASRSKMFPLLDCIRYWHDNQCENPCDKLYGLQAILKESERIEVDYNNSPIQVFLHAVAIILATQVWGHCAADVWKLAKSMGIMEWRNVDKASLKAVVALAGMKKEAGEAQKQLEQQLHDCLICLIELDVAGFQHWMKGCRMEAGISEDAWARRLDSVIL